MNTSDVFNILQILDVERMLSKSATPAEILAQETHQQQMENHPVIRTLYDHSGVSVLTFDLFAHTHVLGVSVVQWYRAGQ